MSANFHPLVYLIDYIMGMIMWTLIGRVGMNIFQREDSSFFFMKIFVKITDPLINLFKPLTEKFFKVKTSQIHSDWAFSSIRSATKIEDSAYKESSQYLIRDTAVDAKKSFNIFRFVLNQLIDSFIEDAKNNNLQFGIGEDISDFFGNLGIGVSGEISQERLANKNAFERWKQGYVNTVLQAAKGPQTDGDARRAL